MGGGATKEATAKAPEQAQKLIEEIDNSNSILHVNVHTTFIVGIVSLAILVVILLFFFPCLCCKEIGIFCNLCCNRCFGTEIRPPPPMSIRGGEWSGWSGVEKRNYAAWTAPHRQTDTQYMPTQQPVTVPQGSMALSQQPVALKPRQAEATWISERVYPSVAIVPPHNTPESSDEF